MPPPCIIYFTNLLEIQKKSLYILSKSFVKLPMISDKSVRLPIYSNNITPNFIKSTIYPLQSEINKRILSYNTNYHAEIDISFVVDLTVNSSGNIP